MPDDLQVDAVWQALVCGDFAAAADAAGQLVSAPFAERAALDQLAVRDGRAAALVAALDAGSSLAARYDASDAQALRRLRALRDADAGIVWLERARRSESAGQRLWAARAAQQLSPGSAEASAVIAETLLAERRYTELEEFFQAVPPRTARLALAERRFQVATGRHRTAAEGVLDDLQAQRVTPASLLLLQDALLRLPDAALEARARQSLQSWAPQGARLQRARGLLLSRLLAAQGRLPEATALLSDLHPRLPADDALLAQWRTRAGAPATGSRADEPATLEQRIDADPQRSRSVVLAQRRLADEWDLAARESYADTAAAASLDEFTQHLDAAAQPLPGSPSLSGLPRTEFGIFGTMLDVRPLRTALPDALLLGGKALTQPAELAWFDRIDCADLELPDALGRFEQCLVRRPRVQGYLASRGAAIAGAGLDRTVYLDLDAVEREERLGSTVPHGADLAPLPAQGTAARRALSEPLDVVPKLERRARQAAGSAWRARLLESLALHERQHIVDFQRFVAQGVAGQFWTLLDAGLLPGAVRAAIERRAQLQALREAADPRVPLAQLLAVLPVEGAALQDEHARGYAQLAGEFLEVLDLGRYAGAQSLTALGLDPDAVLLQQLDRLPPETVRAIALAIDD